MGDLEDEGVTRTSEIPVPVRRRRLGGLVIGTVSACALILVAAGIARVSHASGEPQAATKTDLQPPAPVVPAAPEAVRPAETATTGTVRLERPSLTGRVWLDGKKLVATSAVVSCGAHELKIGARGHARSIDVPCGGDFTVSK